MYVCMCWGDLEMWELGGWGGDKHKALACGEERKLLCVTESIGSLFAVPGRQLTMRTD